MKKVVIAVEEYVYAFYEKIGQSAGGLCPETVMSDALFRLAGELSMEAIEKKVCRNLGVPFAEVSKYENDPANTGSGGVAGVRWHPNDNGMRRYAEAAFRAFLETASRK